MAPSASILASGQPDPDFQNLLKSLELPPLPTNLDVPAMWRVMNGLKAEARAALGGSPQGLTERDVEIPVRDGSNILAYVYTPVVNVQDGASLPILVYFHAGGFCLGDRRDDMDSNRALALRASIIVVSVDYRLAPEHPFPQAIHDGLDALQWISQNASTVHPYACPSAGLIVGGTSAGGHLANSIVYANRNQSCPVHITGQFLSAAPLLPSPLVPPQYKDDYISHEQNLSDTFPPPELERIFIEAYNPDVTSTLFAPFTHPLGHRNIPPTYLQACGLDTLRDDSLIYERILRDDASIATRLDLYPGLPHHFWDFFPQLTRHIEKRTKDTVNGILWLLGHSQATLPK